MHKQLIIAIFLDFSIFIVVFLFVQHFFVPVIFGKQYYYRLNNFYANRNRTDNCSQKRKESV